MEFGSGRRGRRCPAPPTGQRGRRGLTTAAVFIAIHNGRRRPSRSSWWKIRTRAVDRELHAAWRLRPDGLAAPGMGQAHPPKGPTDSSPGRNAVLDINAIAFMSRTSGGGTAPACQSPRSTPRATRRPCALAQPRRPRHSTWISRLRRSSACISRIERIARCVAALALTFVPSWATCSRLTRPSRPARRTTCVNKGTSA